MNEGKHTRGKTARQVLLEAAFGYAAQGIPVFPCKRDKKPVTPNGFKAATTDARQIRAWWSQTAWNIGVPTGKLSGRIVLDVDPPHGEASLQELEAKHGQLPETLQVRTKKGRHLYFRWPGVFVQISADLRFGGKGLDMRGDGGYVIAPPSLFPTGDASYTFTNSLPLAMPPDWLIQLANTTSRKANPKPKEGKAPGSTRVKADRLVSSALLNTTEGESRNDAGLWLACQLRDNRYSQSEAWKAMLCYLARVKPTNVNGELEPYTEQEAEATLRQAYKRRPREPWSGSAPASATEAQTEGRPVIIVRGGQLPWMTDEAGKILANRAEGLRVFQRGTFSVRAFSLPDKSKTTWGGTILERQKGAIMLEPLQTAALTDILGRIIHWQRFNKKGELCSVDCPPQVANTYRSRTGGWGLPVLGGIISAPCLRPDGSVLHRAGYDRETGLFLTEDWPAPDLSPTKDDALMALGRIVGTFDQFPFVSEADRSVFLSAILTAIQRRLLDSAPLMAFSAPSQRTGKSLAAECIAIIATGKEAPAMAVSTNREEMRKAVAAVLLEGHAIVNLDNVEYPLRSPDLARALTQRFYQDRVLGKTETTHSLPTNLLWTVTGNNLSLRGDLAVRALLCQLDAKMERPEERHFKIPFLRAHVAQHRQELVTDILTILRAYAAAGHPEPSMAHWADFEEWNLAVRAPLVWLGLADPYATHRHVVEEDPDRELAAAAFLAFRNAFEDQQPVGINEIVQIATEYPDLHNALLGIAHSKQDPEKIDSYILSHWFRDYHKRVINGLRLEKGEPYKGRPTWFIKAVP